MKWPFFQFFPNTNLHQLNLDWIVEVINDFMEKYTTIDEKIDDGKTELEETYNRLNDLLDAWYTEHSSDIANELADALTELNAWYTEHSEDISDELASALSDLNAWYNEHSEDIAGALASALSDFNDAVDTKVAAAIASIPDDYSEVTQEVLRAIKGIGVMISSSALLDQYTGNTKSANNFPINSVVMIGATNIGLLDYPALIAPYSGTGTYITFCDSLNVSRGIGQLYISGYGGTFAYRYKYGGSDNFSAWSAPVQGQNLMIVNEAGLSTITKTTKSVLNFPENTIQTIGVPGDTIGLVDYPGDQKGRGTYVTLAFSIRSDNAGRTILYIDPYGRMYTNIYFNSTNGWSGWRLASDNVCYVNCKFPNAEAGFTSTFTFEAGKTYYLKTNIQSNINSMKLFNVFVEGHSDEFARVFDSYVKYTPSFTGALRVANRNNYTGTMILEVRPDTPENRLVWNTPREYHVDINGNGDFTSYTDCILSFVKGYDPAYENDSMSIWQDESPKVIYIHPGVYNVFNEYVTETLSANPRLHAMSDIPDNNPASNWFGKYNAIVPPNTKIIGIGDVTLQFTPTTAEIGIGASKTWSPLNIKSEVYVENINILAKNCRYGVHDDPGTGKYGNTKHIYKNVKVTYTEDDTNYGRLNTIGFGYAENGYYLFEDCEFVYDGANAHGVHYGHDSGVGHAAIIIKNCIIRSTNVFETKAVRVQTIQSTTANPSHNTMKIDNCYIESGINLDLYSSTALQGFEITCLNSGIHNVSISRASGNVTDNPYPVRFFNA